MRLGCSAQIRNSDRLYHSDTLWRVASGPGADFWDPSKSEGAPKTVQKIQYGDFLAPLGGQKVNKKMFWKAFRKNMKFLSKIYAKMGGF